MEGLPISSSPVESWIKRLISTFKLQERDGNLNGSPKSWRFIALTSMATWIFLWLKNDALPVSRLIYAPFTKNKVYLN